MIPLAYTLVALATLDSFVWCVMYHRLTRGGWWSTTKEGANGHGRNFMALMAVLCLMMAFTLFGPLLPLSLLLWVSVILFAAVNVVVIHRGYLLWTDQRRAHPRVRRSTNG